METGPQASILQRALEKKKKDFPRLSIRWIAAKLDMSHVYLSYILKGKRPIPMEIIEPLCDILDVDNESRTQVYMQTMRSRGYRPPGSPVTRIQGWSLMTVKNFDLLKRWEPLAILLATQLKDYDGSVDFIAKRLDLPVYLVQSTLDLLQQKGFLVKNEGRLTASKFFYEFQSQYSKSDIRKYQRSVLSYTHRLIDFKTDEESLARRHLVSGVFTCSKETALKFKAQINDFVKACIEEGSASSAEEVYQLAVQLFPVSSCGTAKDPKLQEEYSITRQVK